MTTEQNPLDCLQYSQEDLFDGESNMGDAYYASCSSCFSRLMVFFEQLNKEGSEMSLNGKGVGLEVSFDMLKEQFLRTREIRELWLEEEN